MNILDYLTQHAVENVWCSPLQDRQAMIQPARLTPFGGSVGDVKVMWDTIPLPDNTNDYHVYQIGQNNPYRLALMNERCEWIKISDLCNSQNGIIDIYTETGIQLPRTESYIRRNHDKNFILAVKLQPKIADLNQEKLFFRFYKGAYYDTVEQDPTTDHVFIAGGTMKSVQQAVDLQNLYNDHLAMTGTAYLFHNGKYVSSISPATVIPGDVVEFVYDASILKIIDFKIDDLPSYESSLDRLMKYLIHPNKYGDEVILFRDDVDFFIMNETDTRTVGVYYHKNREPSVRMITHRDYGIPVSYVRSFIDANFPGVPTSRLRVRIHIKKSGYNRPLVLEHNRIHELYKLSDKDIIRAMVGIDSTLDEWKVAHLELSNYTKIMRSFYPQITSDMVVDAYGYNAIVKLVANTPTKIGPPPLENYVELPVGLMAEATFFEYDENGLLLEWRTQRSGERYYARNPETKLVEGIIGLGGKAGYVVTNDDTNIEADFGYRFYRCRLTNNLPDNQWEEVVESPTTFQIEDGVCVWKHNKARYIGAVKSDRRFVCYEYEISARDDYYEFTLNTDANIIDPLWIVPGKLDLWVNGHALIENLDYYVKWPRVVVVNAEWLRDDKQTFVIRATGFCESDMSRILPDQTGWVEHGLLSLNDRYNIRDDKVIRIVVDGGVYDRTDVKFAELLDGEMKETILDGRPYQIENLKAPVRGLSPTVTKELMERSLDLDERLSDYLSVKIPEPEQKGPVYIAVRYHVFSPLMGRLIADIINGVLDIPFITQGDRQIKEIVAPYLDILNFDPAYLGVNKDYVYVKPHPRDEAVEVTNRAWVFLEAVNRLYFGSRLQLTEYVKIRGQ